MGLVKELVEDQVLSWNRNPKRLNKSWKQGSPVDALEDVLRGADWTSQTTLPSKVVEVV